MRYDVSGRLIEYNASVSTRFVYDGARMIAEVSNPAGTIQRRYVHGPGTDEPIVWYEGSGRTDRRFLQADERGSIVAITDSTGAKLGINSYDEFGIPAATNIGRFGFTGQTWFPELGLANYKARWYSPTLGRFMQTDPIGYGDGLNWYNYVHSDPVNFKDPSGTDWDVIGPKAPSGGGGPGAGVGFGGGNYGGGLGPGGGGAPGAGGAAGPVNPSSTDDEPDEIVVTANKSEFALPPLPSLSQFNPGLGFGDSFRAGADAKSKATEASKGKNDSSQDWNCAVAFGILTGAGATSVVGNYIGVIGYVPLPQAKLIGLAGAGARFVGNATALAAGAYIAANCQ